jgi:C_GCAxxG_C_C family probable redox protein
VRSEVLDIEWIQKHAFEGLVSTAKENGLQNIRSGWPSHQSVFKGACEALRAEAAPQVMRALSGFGGGIAGLGGACGALCGGIAALGYFFGTDERRDFSPLKAIIDDPGLSPSEKMRISEENLGTERLPYTSLVHLFRDRFGAVECEALIRPFRPDLVSRERFYHCHAIISETTGFVARIVVQKATGAL